MLRFEIKAKLAEDIAASLQAIEDMCSKGDGYNLSKLNDDELILMAYALGLTLEIFRQGEKKK